MLSSPLQSRIYHKRGEGKPRLAMLGPMRGPAPKTKVQPQMLPGSSATSIWDKLLAENGPTIKIPNNIANQLQRNNSIENIPKLKLQDNILPSNTRRYTIDTLPTKKISYEPAKPSIGGQGNKRSSRKVVLDSLNIPSFDKNKKEVPEGKATLSEGLRRSSIEISSLETKVQELEKELVRAQRTIHTKDLEIQSRRNELENAKAMSLAREEEHKKVELVQVDIRNSERKVDQIQKLLDISEQQLKHARSQLEVKTKKLNEAEDTTRSKESLLVLLREEVELKEQELAASSRTNKELVSKCTRMETEAAQLKEEKQSRVEMFQKEEYEGLQVKVGNLTQTITQLENELSNARTKLSETLESRASEDMVHIAEMTSLKKQLGDKDATYATKLQQFSSKYELQSNDLANKLKASQKEIERLSSEVRGFGNVRKALERSERSRDILQTQLNQISQKTASHAQEQQKLKRLAVDETAKVSVLEKSVLELKDSNQKLKQNIVELTNTVEAKTTEHEKAQLKVQQLENELQHVEAAWRKDQEQWKDAQGKLEDMSIEVSEKSKLAASLRQELKESKAACLANVEENKDLKTKLAGLQKLKEEMEDELRKSRYMQGSFETAKLELERSFHTKCKELERLTQEIESLEANVRQKNSELSSHTETIALLQASNDDKEAKNDFLSNQLKVVEQQLVTNGTANQKHAGELANAKATLETEIIKLQGKLQGLETALGRKDELIAELKKATTKKAGELEFFYSTLQTASHDVSALQDKIHDLQAKADAGEQISKLLRNIKEEMNGQKSVQNLRVLLKSADTTDATTYLEFAKLKERNLEQQMQILVYNITACESHMATCDPVATEKQRVTREMRMRKLEEELLNRQDERKDYLCTSRTNRDRLVELLKVSEAKLNNTQERTRAIVQELLEKSGQPYFEW